MSNVTNLSVKVGLLFSNNYFRSVSDSVTAPYCMLVEYSIELNSLQLAMHLLKRSILRKTPQLEDKL